MQTEIIISGFGGQGALFAGQLLAYAAMDNGLEVTWIPSYGPEMRGGTANCTVVIGDEPIGSPLVRHPQAVIALNLPSVDKYAPLVKPGGILVYNHSLAPREVSRPDIRVLRIPATDAAVEIGDSRLANMVCLGAFLAAKPIVSLAAITAAMEAHLPERHRRFLEPNRQALQRGAELAKATSG